MSEADSRTKDSVSDPYDLCLWGLHEGDPRVIMDDRHAARIPLEKRCKRCAGTGNELMWMFRKCEACGGSGESKEETAAPLTPGQLAYYADADGDLEGYDGA